LKISIHNKKPTESVIKIKIGPSDYEKEVENKIKEIKSKINLKGFRPGMVPVSLINKMYGKNILIEEINKLVSHKLTDFIREKKINLIGEPLPEGSNLKNIDWKKNKNFEFYFRIGMISEFKLADFSKKIKVNKYELKVEKKTINETIKNLQNQFPNLNNQDQIKSDSIVQGIIKNIKEKKKKQTTLYINSLNKIESKKFLKKKKGDIVNFNLHKLTNSNTELLTQITGEKLKSIDQYPMELKFIVEKIENQTPSDINIDFFDKIFGKGKVKTKKEFIKKVEESIKSNYDKESQLFLNRIIKKTITLKHKISIPEEFLKVWIKKNNDQKIAKNILEENYKGYCDELKWSFIVDKIISKKNIKVENNEIEEVAKNQIRYQLQSSGIQNPEKELDKFAKKYLKQNSGDNYFKIFNQIKSSKAINEIKKKISILNKTITFEEFKSLTSKELSE